MPDAAVHASRASLGVALSGGGARAFAVSLGATRGLSRLGVLDQTRVVSSVSGGSWFNALFAYSQQTEGATDASLLCAYHAPANESLARLATVPAGCLAGAPSAVSLYAALAEELALARKVSVFSTRKGHIRLRQFGTFLYF